MEEERDISGAGAGRDSVPVPEKETFTLPSSESLLVTVRVPDLLPAEEGVKVTVTVWAAPATTVNEVGVGENWLSDEVMPVTDRLALPVLEIVNVFPDDCPI